MIISLFMKKLSSVFVLLLLCAGFSFAQTISIDEVFASITEHPVTAGDFVQEKNAAKLKRPLKSSGNYLFSGEGIVWKTLKPFPSVMAVTKTAIIQTKADGTKNITDGSTNEVFKSVASALSSIFSGDRAVLEHFFVIDGFSSTETGWSLLITPKDSTINAALKQIQISGSASGKTAAIDFMKIIQSESEFTSYSFTNQSYRKELNDEEKALFK